MTTLETQPTRTREDEGDMLRDYLRGRSMPCPNCGYDLRDLTGQSCPECGQQLALAVHLVEPRLAAFVTGLVALAASVGFSGLLLIYVGLILVIDGRGVPIDEVVVFTAVPFVISLVLLGIWLWCRPSLRGMSSLSRWSLAVFTWCTPLANVLTFAFNIR